MEMMKKIPLGIDDYRIVSRECYYVDKTLLIKDIATLPGGSVVLFTRPRRFGKSLALSMLDTFFDEKIGDASIYFQDKAIAKESEYALMGGFPTVLISLKDMHSSDYESLLKQIKEIIRREYARHDELESSPQLSENDIAYCRKAIAGELDESELPDSLVRLILMLEAHHQKKVCLFIDEYDTPIQDSYEGHYYEQAISFFRLFYGKALKGNHSLRVAILTGVMRIAKESLFSGLNNLIVDNGFDSAFFEYFGFTRQEAAKLCAYFGAEHPFEELWKWYGGYHFGGEDIMNPWSILSYFRFKKTLKEYWINTSSVSILAEVGLSYSSLLGALLNGEVLSSRPSFSISYADISESADKFLGFLITTGYLTLTQDGVAIPNLETSLALRNEVIARFASSDVGASIYAMKRPIVSGDSEAFSMLLKRVLLHSFSYFDFQQERSYQAMTLTLVSLLFDDCIVKSEVLEGSGRCDILIQPRETGHFGAVIEIKHIKNKTSEARLSDRAKAALEQIKKKGYAEDLILNGARPILAYGIAFYQKKACVEAEILNN